MRKKDEKLDGGASTFYAHPDVVQLVERLKGRLSKSESIRALFQWIERYPEFRKAVFDSPAPDRQREAMVHAMRVVLKKLSEDKQIEKLVGDVTPPDSDEPPRRGKP